MTDAAKVTLALAPPPDAAAFRLQVLTEGESGDEWEDVPIDEATGEIWGRLDEAPSPQQLAAVSGAGTYRVQWGQRNRRSRKLGFSPSFEIDDVAAAATPPLDAAPAAFVAPPDAPTVATHAGLPLAAPTWIAPRSAPGALPAQVVSDPMWQPVLLFDHLNRTHEYRERARDQERNAQAQKDREFTIGMLSQLQQDRDRADARRDATAAAAAAQQQQMFSLVLASVKGEETAKREIALAKAAGPVDLAALTTQLAELKDSLEEKDEDEDAPPDLEKLAQGAGQLLGFLAQSEWARQKVPGLAALFTPAAAE